MNDELVIELEESKIDVSIEEEKTQEIGIENSDTVPTGATKDYKKLVNKPKIEGVELIDNKTFEDLGLSSLSNSELEKLLI